MPLILKERRLVEVGEECVKREVALDAGAEEWGPRNNGNVLHDLGAFCANRCGRRAWLSRLRAGEGLHGRPIRDALCPHTFVSVGQVAHDVKASKSIFGVEDCRRVLAAQIVLNVLAGERGAAADDGNLGVDLLQILDDVLHLEGGFDEEAGKADSVSVVLVSGLDDGGGGLLDAEVDDLVAVVGEDDVDKIFTNVVHVAFDGGEDNGSLLVALGLLHLGLKVSDSGLHGCGGVEHTRQLHLAVAEEDADGLHAVEKDGVDEVERRVAREGGLEDLLEALLPVTFAEHAFAVDDEVLELVVVRHGVGDDGGLFVLTGGLREPGEVLHVDLQRVLFGLDVAEDQVAGELDFLLRDLVERVDLGVVDDGGVEAAVNCLFQKHRIEHAARVGVEAEGDVGHAEDSFAPRQLEADAADGFEGLDACGAVVFLAGGDGQG